MRRADIVTGLLMIGLAAFVIWATAGLAYWRRLVPGPGFMPYWVSLAAGLMGVWLVLMAALRPSEGHIDWPEPRPALRMVVVFALLCLVPIVSPTLGFLSAAVLFLLVSMLFVLRKPLVPSLLTTVVIAAMVHFLFNRWLNVRLPTGPFGF